MAACSMSPNPVVLRPDPDAVDEAALATLSRAALVLAKGKADPNFRGGAFAERTWGTHEARSIDILTKAASAPASTTTAGWAAELARTSVALLKALTPLSAGAALLQRGVQVEFGSAAAIRLPTMAPGIATFVAQGAPIPVEKFAASGPLMEPRKLAAIIELTSELMASSSAETLVRTALVESVGKGLDQVLFDNLPGDAVRPPGLRYGVAGLTPAAAGAKDQVMLDDVIALVSAVAAVASGPITLVAHPAQAMSLQLRSLGTVQNVVLASAALPAGMIIAVADAALAAAIEGPPVIDASRQAELHREDATPQPINGGSGMASPLASIYQLDSVALRLRWQISWCLRAPAIAWMQSVSW